MHHVATSTAMPEASTATPTANDLDVEQGAQGPERQQTISTNSSLEKRLSDAKEAALEDAVTPLDKEVVEDLEDGGFWGWVVVICVMTQSMALWGGSPFAVPAEIVAELIAQA